MQNTKINDYCQKIGRMRKTFWIFFIINLQKNPKLVQDAKNAKYLNLK